MLHGIWTAVPQLWGGKSPVLVERVISGLFDRGIDGVLVLGTTGRGSDLSVSRRMAALEQVVRVAGDGKKIIVSVSANPAEDVRHLLEHAGSLGVKGVAITPPFYGAWTHAELLDWAEVALGAAPSNVELYLYHIPVAVRTGWDQEMLVLLHQRFSLAGIKDSSGDIQQLITYLAWGRDRDFSVMVGNERLATYALMLGGSGVVSGLSMAFPELLLKTYAACQGKDWDAAVRLQQEINEKLGLLAQVSARQTGDVLLDLAREQGVIA